MIHVEFYRDTKNGSVQMEMQGHAETAPKGQDLVCAAAWPRRCSFCTNRTGFWKSLSSRLWTAMPIFRYIPENALWRKR